MSRICWTTDVSMVGYVGRGVWAGHRFDITSMDALEEEIKREGHQWRDVSGEIMDAMVAIVKDYYGA